MHPRWLTRTVCDASELLVAEYSTPHCCLADEVSGRAEPTVLVKLMPLGHLPKVRAVIRATVLCPRNRGRPCRLRGRPGRLFLELRWTWHVSFPLYEVVVSYVRLVLAVRESNTTRTASLTSGLVVLPATGVLGPRCSWTTGCRLRGIRAAWRSLDTPEGQTPTRCSRNLQSVKRGSVISVPLCVHWERSRRDPGALASNHFWNPSVRGFSNIVLPTS